ncbi:MAG: Rieske 2Fe-2S domain-containing protein [Gammaproteobacteria bacterium]|nr:Rieske 2Fe-2S domain-containing protein [Gammaproteobacteria bacterium]
MNLRRSKQAVVQGLSDEARADSYPHPYPSGWYRLLDSRELRSGELRYIECLGRQLVLWRTEDGTANVMSSFCPHLGSNLALGCVIGDRIQCAFHGWQFTGDGRVAHVPYSEHVPQGVLTAPFPVQELHGQLFMYHDSCLEKPNLDEAPPYPVPSIPEVDQGTFVYRGAYDAGRVKMNIVEFAENSVDKAHFSRVHGQMRFPWTQVKVPGVKIEHDTDWYVDPDIDWKMYFVDKAMLTVFGRRIQKAGASAVISFFGPGSVVKFRFTVPKLGEIEMYQTHLPVGPLELQVNFRWFADRRLPRLLVWYVIGNWISQWERDISIWENKIYQQSPRLSRDDGPIFKLRDWYQQFIPKDHPSG